MAFGFQQVRVDAGRLGDALGTPVDLNWTDNTSTMIAMRRRDGVTTLRLHRMFEEVEPPVFDSLVAYCRRGRGRHPELAAHVARHRHRIRQREPKPRPSLEAARGRYFDLAGILASVHGQYFPELPPAAICWGRGSRGRRRIQLAVYDPGEHLIRVNPRLDRADVPSVVMEFLVYHELCHARLIREAKAENRSNGHHHDRRFREMERRFPAFAEVMVWERACVSRL
ncbi:MAG: hypothetical protein KIT79_05335 [Deltaproteobacteria bacterium]|nr:hypothetical protein [Deltaproteobacteria bacterium]